MSTTTVNPFAADAATARTRQEKSEDAKRFKEERDTAIRLEKERNALRAQIKEAIARLIQGYKAAVRCEFTKNPRKPWNENRILAAGEYVAYLTTNFVSGQVPVSPEINPDDAAILRDKFAWQVVVANARGKVKIPDGALVGQHEDWFPALLTKKEGDYARLIERRKAEKASAAPAPTVDESTTDTETEVSADTEPARELTEDELKELAAKFSRQASEKAALKPAITPKGANRRSKKAPSRRKVAA